MIPIIKKFFHDLLFDELAVRRWFRAAIMALAGSGMAWGDQLAAILGTPVKSVKIAAVVAMALALTITAGEKNKEASNAPPAA